MSYQVFITKENDELLVKALECLLCHSNNDEEKENINIALSALSILRPIEWAHPKGLYKLTLPQP